MAPRVRPSRSAAAPQDDAPTPTASTPTASNTASTSVQTPSTEPLTLSEPNSEIERAIKTLRKKIEETSDYVGTDFAEEARAIHLGEAPERSIYGEANAEEAKSLVDEGIPVAPLPFLPGRKSN